MRYPIYKIFANLQQKEPVNKDSFLAASLPFTQKHKIGVSSERFPLFFIECNDIGYSADINLELISVLFNRPCKLSENNIQSESVYTIISLKTENIDFQQYFFEVVCIVLEQLSENPSHKQLKKEIQKLIELFSRFNRPPRKTTQGLWAELFVIERAKNPEYLIQSWHSSLEDKFDFNDGQDKIEVKSTANISRIHRFSLEQLNPNKSSNLLIASLFVVQSGKGKNIFDLINSICKKVQNIELQFKLNETVSETLGIDLGKAFDFYFDYQQACDTFAFFDFKEIPTIKNNDIPYEISNVHFDCDLSNISAIEDEVFITSKSLLFKSVKA
ncbi:MAG: PD-(D/E)XK motif protein [Flavobacterium johnsoniae]|nr:MAG: PD-(D/E)XK motif protein [Flavobacterium johnsoniae]